MKILFQKNISTTEAGKVEGYISYLQNIEDNIDATGGSLTTGDLGKWEDFIISLNSQNIAFRITAGGLSTRYQILYENIASRETLKEFADYLSSIHDNIIVTADEESNKLIFSTKETGAVRGRISYTRETDTPRTPATFSSGTIDDISYEEFIEVLGDKNIGIYTHINGEYSLFYLTNEEIIKLTNFEELTKVLFINDKITASFSSNNYISLTTLTSGEGSTFEYFNNLDHIDATNSYLETGYLNDLESIKESLAESTLNITFYLEADGVENNFIITPEELKELNDYNDLVKLLLDQQDNLNIEYDAEYNRLLFIVYKAGKKSISYLQYREPGEEEEQTINGAMLFSGTEEIASITEGTDEINNILDNTTTILKLTEEMGAKIVNGSSPSFAKNSIALMRGTENTGAVLLQGKDGVVVTLNASATFLRDTMEQGALRIAGTDDGIPEYDGYARFIGSVLVTDQVEAERLLINKEMERDNRRSI